MGNVDQVYTFYVQIRVLAYSLLFIDLLVGFLFLELAFPTK